MSTEIESEVESEEITLTESDLAVIEELNQDRDPEGSSEIVDEIDEQVDEGIEPKGETSEDTSEASVEDSTPSVEFPQDMLQTAQYYGVDVNDFSNVDALGRVLDSFVAYENNVQNYYNQQNQQAVGEGVPTQEQILEEFKIGLDATDYDEGMINAVNELSGKIAGHFSQQIQALQNELSYQRQFVDTAYRQQSMEMAQRQVDEFDSGVTELKHKDLFGDKPFQELDSGGKEAQNREKLYSQMAVLANGYQVSGQPVPAYKELMQQAYRALFGNEIEALNRRRTNDRFRKAASRKLGGGKSSKQSEPVSDDPIHNQTLKDAYEAYERENGDL